jgi:hypothetical protein
MKQYRIDELLATGEQWFERLDDETYQALADGLNAHGDAEMTVPIVISERGRLLDGHHRLMVMQTAGRKILNERDVRIDHTATDPETEALASIAYQFRRRQLGAAEKAKLARDLMRRFGWSLGTIAKQLGVSRPAVSKWLIDYPDPTFVPPDERTGADGKTYTVPPDPEPTTKRPKAEPDYSPVWVVDDYTRQLCNPGWGQWVRTWSLVASDEGRADVVANLNLLAAALGQLAEDVAAVPNEPVGGGF